MESPSSRARQVLYPASARRCDEELAGDEDDSDSPGYPRSASRGAWRGLPWASVAVGVVLLTYAAAHHCFRVVGDSVGLAGAEPSAVVAGAEAEVMEFRMPGEWANFCEHVVPPANPSLTWHKQNRCWEWMKQVSWESCRRSWSANQLETALAARAPYPSVVPIAAMQDEDLCESPTSGLPTGQSIGALADELQESTAWLASNIQVLVLSLPGDPARRELMTRSLAGLGVEFSFADGFNFSDPGQIAGAVTSGWVPADFNLTRFRTAGRTTRSSGIVGTLGCATGHLRAMRLAMQRRPSRPLTLILEDDIILVPDFAAKLRRLLQQEAPQSWAAISLKSYCPIGRCVTRTLSRVLPDGADQKLRCRGGVNYGFSAMLYHTSDLERVRARLEEIVYDDRPPLCADIDTAFAALSDEFAYYAVPAAQEPGFYKDAPMPSTRRSMDDAESF